MKNFKRIITLCLALALCLSCAPAVFAAEVADATIDMSRKGSLTIYKYDLTNAEKDGVWDSSYVSTGVYDQSGVVDVLGGKRAGDTDNKSDLGNGEASYLNLYKMTARELAKTIIDDVRETVGTVSTCGIGTNLYLAKIALDLHAKHAADFIAELDEDSYREKLWDHKPITDFWQIAAGKAERLRNHGITTMRDIAMMKEDYLYDWFGIDAELLIDHAWGREPTTIADIKAYRSKSKSLSSGQVLMRDYRYDEGLVIVKEMMDQLCLDMVAKKLATDSVSLYVGYSYTQCIGGAKGTANLACETNADSIIVPAVATLYKRIVNPAYAIRRICLCCNSVVEDHGVYQLNMFDDISSQLRSRAIQETMLGIKAKYGKNAILKGVNYDPAATGRERNLQIGGHKSNG